MKSGSREPHEVRPARPEDVVGALLEVTSARRLPLQAGDKLELPAGPEEYQLVAAWKGNLTAFDRRYTLLEPGQALCCAGPCRLQAVSNCLCMTLRFSGELAKRLLAGRMTEGSALFPQGAAAVRETVLSLAVLEREKPPVDGETASGYAYSLLLKLRSAPAEEHPNLSPLVSAAVAIIQEEFPYLEGMDELAERLEVSKAHLIRSFVRKTGVSPGKYLIRVRIEYAKLLLQDEDATVAYAAAASGFANANYFAKAFRRETGMSPTEYRDSHPVRKISRGARGPGDW